MKYIITYLSIILGIAANAQSLVSVSPNTGAAGTSVSVTITGSGTSFTNSTLFVLSAGTSILTVSNVTATSATVAQATITIPANATAGAYRLSTLAGITPIQLNNAFTVTGGAAAASIVSVTPGQGYQGQFAQLEIVGENTLFSSSTNTSVSLVKTGSTPIIVSAFAISDSVLSGFLSIPSDAALGSYSMVITTSNNGILTKTNAFEIVLDPKGMLSALEPNEGNKGDTVAVILEGTGTSFTQMIGIEIELFGTTSGGVLETQNLQVLTDSTLSFDVIVPAKARTGIYDIYMRFDTANTANFLTLSEAFTVTGDPASDPQLVSVTPSTAKQGETLDIVYHATNTSFTDSSGLDFAIFNQDTFIQPDAFVIIDDTTIKATYTIVLPVGIYDVGVISNTDGYLQLLQSFTVVENTGVNELYANGKPLKVFPNPAKDNLTVETANTVVNISIIDMQGKVIRVETGHFIKGEPDHYTVDLEAYHLLSGIHFIRLETDQGIQYQKFIVQ